MRTFIATYVANRYAKPAVAAIMKAVDSHAAPRRRITMTNLLSHKIKKIVAEHGYLNKSMLTEFELKQLGHEKGRFIKLMEEGCGYPGLPENGKQS